MNEGKEDRKSVRRAERYTSQGEAATFISDHLPWEACASTFTFTHHPVYDDFANPQLGKLRASCEVRAAGGRSYAR